MKYYLIRQPDGTLWLCFSKPVRWAETGMWCVNGGNMKRLPDGDFEEVKSSAKEPAELEMSLTIKSHSHEHDINLFELLVTGMYLFLLPAMISVAVAFVLIGLGIMSKDMFWAVVIIGYFTHHFVCSLGLLRGKKMPNVLTEKHYDNRRKNQNNASLR